MVKLKIMFTHYDYFTDEPEEKTRTYLRKKVEEYMNRAEKIKKIVLHQKETGLFHEQVHIENNSTGHSYKTLFGRFLDEDVDFVLVEDPYIRSYHQVCIVFGLKIAYTKRVYKLRVVIK